MAGVAYSCPSALMLFDAKSRFLPVDSLFHQYFNTNYIPTDAEIDHIRTHLVPHDAELARIESLIRDLTIQRDEIKEYIEPHRALVSHPRRLPQDLVERIFLHCLPTEHNAIMSPSEAPMLLGRICSAWRFIAFAFPRLWASLHVSTAFSYLNKDRQAAIFDWLNRSAQVPLVISAIQLTGDLFDKEIDIPISFSPRWSSLHISDITTKAFLKLYTVNAPLLTDVRFAFGRNLRKEQGPSVLSSPLLRRMQYGRITIAASDLNALVPPTLFTWHHLSNLSLELSGRSFSAVNSQTAYRLLKGCTHLKSLKFPFYSSEPGPLTEELLVVPSLESLVIIDESLSFDALGNLASHLAMPRLTQLSLEINPTGAPSDMVFLERLARHSPLISDLTLNISNFTITSLVSTLPLFSCLAKLSLLLKRDGDAKTAAELLAFLTPNSSALNPCPALQELIIESRGFADTIWLKFLQNHLDCSTRLRRLHLRFRCDPQDTIPDVEQFLARGLDVSLMYSSKRRRVTPETVPSSDDLFAVHSKRNYLSSNASNAHAN